MLSVLVFLTGGLITASKVPVDRVCAIGHNSAICMGEETFHVTLVALVHDILIARINSFEGHDFAL